MEFVLIYFVVFFGIALFIKYSISNSVKNQFKNLEEIKSKLILEKYNVRSENITIGLRNTQFLFRKAELKFLDDAFFIFGYSKVFKYKFYSCLIILTHNENYYRKLFKGAKIVIPKKVNLNSFDKDVYIEFGEAGFTTTSVEIRLKGLSDQEKEKIKI